MSSSPRCESKEATLNADSWVELHFPRTPPGEGVVNRSPLWGGQMEKLLLDAQRDPALSSSTRSSTPGPGRWSAASSRGASSRGSPRSGGHSPNQPMAPTLGLAELSSLKNCSGEQGNPDWIWDWSSRPELLPPSEHGMALHHPAVSSVRRPTLSMRNTSVMRRHDGYFSITNLPMILFTHACTFVLGAAAMFLYLKKYCSWNLLSRPTIN